MILFIDCEFNSFKGELLSMALVPLVEEKGNAFYCEIKTDVELDPWVKEHVVFTREERVMATYEEFQARLEIYLARFSHIHLIADWPEDVTHFTQALITGPGERIDTPPLTIEIRRDLDSMSEVPHNALMDALSIRQTYMDLEEEKQDPVTTDDLEELAQLLAYTEPQGDEDLDTTVVQATVVDRDPEHVEQVVASYIPPMIVLAENDIAEQERARYTKRKEFVLHGKPHIAYSN